MKEQIDHPKDNINDGTDVADFIDAHDLNFNKGNIIRLVVSAEKEYGEDAVAVLLKAQQYLSREIIRAGHEQENMERVLYLCSFTQEGHNG